jgi:alkylglycerol monooxygenase
MADRIMFWAIPGFFLLMGIEWLASLWSGRRVYRANDAINSIGLGLLSQIVAVFTKVMTIGIYAWVASRFSVFSLPVDRVWVWVSGLLLYDFCYYWLHRCGHEVGVLWAAHVVHHQSERYNLSTALRQTSSGALLGWLFYMPMALLGYPLEVFAVVAAIDLLYQYWIHTELVGKLGWFDRVFASPSNHRAHHAVNDRYLDKNYGGLLILWDRLFGTFVEEDAADPPKYGTRAPLRSWNPIWANLEVYSALARDAWHARRWRDKVRVWFAPPGWRPADVAERFPKPAFEFDRADFDPPLPSALKTYCLMQFLLSLGLGVHFLQLAPHADTQTLVLYALLIAASLVVLGALLERRRWSAFAEALRLLLIGGYPAVVGGWFAVPVLPVAVRIGFMALATVSLVSLWWSARRPLPAPVPAPAPLNAI